MSNVFRSNLVIEMSGASHTEAMRIKVSGFPKGIKIDTKAIEEAISRRMPNSNLSNARHEADDYTFVSGVNKGKTNGEELIIEVKNQNFNSGNYQKGIIRPGHVDYPAYVKYGDNFDYRGGGEFSGRLTILIAILGAISKTALKKYGVVIGSHLYQIGNIKDKKINYLKVNAKTLHTSKAKLAKMEEAIIKAKNDGDSIGGTIEVIACGVKVGLGENYFGGLESKISSLMFAIPGAKEVSFGKDLDLSKEFGSTYNDQMTYIDGEVNLLSNNAGGINGGLSNGCPIVVRVKFRPTSSISKKQKSIDILNKENIDLTVKGNHDSCFAYRAGVIVEGMMAIALLDSYLEEGK